ncbi:acetyl-CoA hydrolase/transferase C-terminal domain-containing protein [Pseudohongiella acticola]|jgi:acyl-CoA hydrolase|uniref:acetyl-CoA hydrolase/transferase C-terminal domain-containing protein n=1 Tax=Pseudohongiella acticola TaxID=1524254 RepID=UPI0030EEF43C
MTEVAPRRVTDVDAAVQAIIDRVGNRIVLGLPLGVGKPVRLANALYQRACKQADLNLHIVTGLSLLVPKAGSSMEKRFLEPFTQRLFGNVPTLDYVRDAASGNLPGNVKVSEFFFQAGSFVSQSQQQRDYVCSNYTHAVRDLMAQGLNVVAQMVAPDPEAVNNADNELLSLSSNPDLTLDLIPLLRQREADGTPIALVAEINAALPFMGHHAAVPAETFDVVLHDATGAYPLFSVPQTSVSEQDHLIGFYASTLLRDGGTLQVGIGSLGTALVHSTILRHSHNADWVRLYHQLDIDRRCPGVSECGGSGPFVKGLYGCSEMMMEGFLDLMEAGILTRNVYEDAALQEAINSDDNDALTDLSAGSPGVVMHGGFFLGSRAFYDRLHKLTPAQRELICMTSVNFTNDLFDHRYGNQRLKVAQRIHSRFINTALMHTLDGAAISDGLQDGRVISGVGGQYNFVAMAHELADARSIVTLRSTREKNGKVQSNIVFSYGHCTIPRHLRDIVITEYGIADLRGQPDEEVYRRMIAVADARFQPALLAQAKEAGKISEDFDPPEHWRENTPDRIKHLLAQPENEGLFPAFPFGHDFSAHEMVLARALKKLQGMTSTLPARLTTLLRAILNTRGVADQDALLARMSLQAPKGINAWIEKRMLIFALTKTSGQGGDATQQTD